MTEIAAPQRLAPLGIETRVLDSGPADSDEAVVLLHGHPGSAEDWAHLFPRIAASARTIALDWPGFGQAERPREMDYSAGTLSIWLEAAFSQLGVRRAHLVMHDLGGVALLWGAAHPDAFASAVLMHTGILRDFRWHPVARLYRSWPFGELATAMTTRAGFRLAMRLYNRQPRKLPDEIIDRWWSEYPLRTRRAALAFYRATPEELMERLVEPLRAIDVPALALWGAHDIAVPIEQAERQRDSFPRAEVVILPDSGHWPYLDSPEDAAAVIVPFIEGQVA